LASKIVLSICALLFGLVVPILEINETHVFNPAWPGHARLHEVWQLISNSSLAALCLWLVWRRGDIAMGGLIALIVTGGFVLSYLLRGLYDGTMKHADGTELAIGGYNVAVVAMIIAVAAIIWVITWQSRLQRH
jgi:hypothetical protein